MNATTLRTFAASAAIMAAASADDYVVNVPLGETQTIDATLVADIGTKNLVKTGRGVLVSSADMAAYTGTITVREGAFEVTTSSDLGTSDGGTVVEDGGTLVVNMRAKDQWFSNENFTIAGTGDAAYGAAIYQSDFHNNDQNKLFKNLTLSGDATIFAGTHLGISTGTLSMDGHTLTVTGSGDFTFRVSKTTVPVGNLIVECRKFRFRGGSDNVGDASKYLIVRSGSTLLLGYPGDNIPPIWWNLIVQDGGKVKDDTSGGNAYCGDVEWNSTATDGASGPITFSGNVTGSGTIKSSDGKLTLKKPLGAGVGLGLSGTATATLPTAKAYSYTNKGMMLAHDNRTSVASNFKNDKVSWSEYCAEGPGPQISRSYWTQYDGNNNTWGSKGYIWNREPTNVTYTLTCKCTYKTYVWGDGFNFSSQYNENNSCTVDLPPNTCKLIRIVTEAYTSYQGGPASDADAFKINGITALDETGYYFTKNEVSTLENPAALPTLSLADDGVLDMNGMPLSVDAVSGAGLVTNVTTLAVSNSWTLAATDIDGGAVLTVDGTLSFGNGCSLAVTGLENLPTAGSYTVASADSISGITTAGIEVAERGRTWKFVLSGDGKSIALVYVPQATTIIMR